MTADRTESLAKLGRILPWLLVVGSIIGIISSSMLVYDQIQIWQNPSYQPDCSLNPIINCGSVINSHQGEVFGIPAPFFGLTAFPALLAVGVALLAGARFKRWFWQGLELGAIGGMAFAIWLFWVSLYRVQALCPFCLSVDVVIYTLFWYLTLHNLREGNIRLPHLSGKAIRFMSRHHLDILFAAFVVVAVIILHHFWDYFGQFI